MSFYHGYYLSENPFPITPILEPTSDDDRINGTIFNSEIMAEELESFQRKIRRRPPLIYIENSDFIRGVGKSALVVQQWRRLKEHRDVTSIYLRSEKRFKPTDFAARFISSWHQNGHLWSTVLNTIQSYADEDSGGAITRAGAEAFVGSFPQLPHHPISLLNFMVYNPDQLISDLAVWAHRKTGKVVQLDLAQVFFESYLTDPRSFPHTYPKVLRKHKWDGINMLAGVYRLMKIGGYGYHYIFLDQFEDIVHGLSGKSLITFNAEMRRLIEASIGQATLIVTLHPGATATLSSDEGGDITSIAPLDQRHVVDVRSLQEEGARHLAMSYLDYFRLEDSPPPDALYPFTDEAIREIYNAAKGNIRACLQAFNYAVEKGVDDDYPAIDKAFLAKYHSDITGRVSPDEVVL